MISRLFFAAGAVALLVALPVAASPLEDFTASLAAIPASAGDPIPRAQSALRRFARLERDIATRDSAVLAFRAYLADVVERWNVECPLLDITARVPRSLRSRIRANHLELAASEGIYYIRSQPAFLAGAAAHLASPPVAQFLSLEAADARKAWQDDGGLAISWTALAERVVAWENYLDRYPVSAVSREAEAMRLQYVRAFWTGTENSPAFDWLPDGNQGPVRREIRAALDHLERRHPHARFTRDTRQWLDLLDRNGGRTSPAITAFLAAHGIGTDPG